MVSWLDRVSEDDVVRFRRLLEVDKVALGDAARAIGLPRSMGGRLAEREKIRKPSGLKITDDLRFRIVDMLSAGEAIAVIADQLQLVQSVVHRVGVEHYILDKPAGSRTAFNTFRRVEYLELLANGWNRFDARSCCGLDKRVAVYFERGVKPDQGKFQVFTPEGRYLPRYKELMTVLGIDPVAFITTDRDSNADSGIDDGRAHQPVVINVVEPTAVEKQIHSRFLSAQERDVIADLYRQGVSIRQIAVRLSRHPSTIKREIDRNQVDGVYHSFQAHRKSAVRRARPKTSKIASHRPLQAFIWQQVVEKCSPEQIAGRLRVQFPNDQRMHVCMETIYQYLYVQARGSLKADVKKALRQGRAERKPRGQRQSKRRFKDEMIHISDRPEEVDARIVPGHWEGDLIIGRYTRSAIGTLVERTTGFTILLHLPHGFDSHRVRDAIVEEIGQLPHHLRKSLTWDQGLEMAQHKSITDTLGCQVYFCDPASPWQRGSNENTNGLLRQYFPKETDLSIHSKQHLQEVSQQLNRRPRKRLNYQTPAERMQQLLNL